MKKAAFLIYAWSSTFIFGGLILWMATVPEFSIEYEEADVAIKVALRITLYFILFLLIYRSLLASLRNIVYRLSKWRSKRERVEDAEFVLIIETLLIIISVLVAIIVSIADKWIQTNEISSNSSYHFEDLFVSLIGILLSATITYILPVIGELEYGVKHRVEEVWKKK